MRLPKLLELIQRLIDIDAGGLPSIIGLRSLIDLFSFIDWASFVNRSTLIDLLTHGTLFSWSVRVGNDGGLLHHICRRPLLSQAEDHAGKALLSKGF